MVVISFQIDNQLPDASAQVLLAATPKKRPLPVVSFFVRQNQTDKPSSQSAELTSIERAEIRVEELDLKLEQEMVLACWAVIQDAQDSLRRNGGIRTEGADRDGFSLLNLLGVTQLMQMQGSVGVGVNVGENINASPPPSGGSKRTTSPNSTAAVAGTSGYDEGSTMPHGNYQSNYPVNVNDVTSSRHRSNSNVISPVNVLAPLSTRNSQSQLFTTTNASGFIQASSLVHTEASAALEASLQEVLGYVNMTTNKTNAHNLMESEDAHKIYINKFVIAPIKVNVTFLVSSQVESFHTPQTFSHFYLDLLSHPTPIITITPLLMIHIIVSSSHYITISLRRIILIMSFG